MYKKARIELTNRSGHIYSVDTAGVVVNETTKHTLAGRIKNGYHLVCINQKYYPVHRLVAKAFIEPSDGKTFVNHIDGNKSNNCVSNLEWCTHTENMRHARDTGLWVKSIGVEHGRCTTDDNEVRKICEYLEQGLNWSNIKHKVGVSRNVYLNIRRRKTWKHISCDYSF